MSRITQGAEINTPLEQEQLGKLGTASIDQSVETAPVDQSVGTQLYDMIKNEDEIMINKPLAVLFSHSSRIRCFLDLLYPANNPSKSIYQLMKDYKNTYGPTGVMKTLNKIPGVKIKGELDIDFKFYNCVVFVS